MFEEELVALVEANGDEIREDLARVRDALARADQTVRELNARATSLEWLVSLMATGQSQPVGTMSLHDAMREVLLSSAATNRMMRPAHLADEINRRGLYRMRDGRPVEPGQISARVGNYPNMFVREGTFVKAL
jgi:hypothetical protein